MCASAKGDGVLFSHLAQHPPIPVGWSSEDTHRPLQVTGVLERRLIGGSGVLLEAFLEEFWSRPLGLTPLAGALPQGVYISASPVSNPLNFA